MVPVILLLLAISQATFMPKRFTRQPKPFRALTCDKYACANDTQVLDSDQCVYYSDDTHFIKPCNSSSQIPYCDPNSGGNVTCGATPDPGVVYNSFPGEECRDAADCEFAKNCTAGICIGALEGDECRENEQCNPGLRCNSQSKQCETLLAANSVGCSTDEDCIQDAGCNITDSGQGICLPYFSVGLGEIVSNCDENYEISDLCETGWCVKSGFLVTHGQCVDAPISNQVAPAICTADSDCTGSSTSSVYEGTCGCGFNPYGNAYCSVFPGDPAGLNYLNAIKYFVNNGNLQKCNTARRFSESCWKVGNTAEYISFTAALEFFEYYNQYVENDDCIKATYTRKYWDFAFGAWLVIPIVMLFS